uniref:hypothetical protein n=1 Tax=Nocardioides stalactiti TaxID=2755356 RepID=UPI001C7E23EF
MRSPLQKAAATAAVLVLTSFAAGCGGDKDSDDADEPKTVTVTETPTDATTAPTTEATTEAPPTDVTPMDQTGDITQEQVEAALLTPAEVSADFVVGSYTDEDNPPLCDPSGLPLDQQVPPQVSGGTQIDHADGIAAIQEEIAIYATEQEAAEAFALGTAGLACTEGSSDGTPVTISAPE